MFLGFFQPSFWEMAEMDKALRNGLIMSEMDPLNRKWLDFAI